LFLVAVMFIFVVVLHSTYTDCVINSVKQHCVVVNSWGQWQTGRVLFDRRHLSANGSVAPSSATGSVVRCVSVHGRCINVRCPAAAQTPTHVHASQTPPRRCRLRPKGQLAASYQYVYFSFFYQEETSSVFS